MSLPRVAVLFANGNLLADIGLVDGVAGLICTATATTGLALETPAQIFSLKDLEALGATDTYRAAAAAVAAVAGVAAITGNITVSTIVADGLDYELFANGGGLLATYTKAPGETTATQIAVILRGLVNAGTGTHGYTAGGTGANIVLTAPVSLGASINATQGILTWLGGSAASNFTGGVTAVTASAAVAELDTVHLHRQVREFYDAVGGQQALWIMTVSRANTMTQMLDRTNTAMATRLLIAAGGVIRLLAVARKPLAGYDGGANFIDADVPTALTAGKLLIEAQRDGLNFFRVLVEGRVANPDSTTVFEPKATANGTAGVVLGGSLPDGSASIGTVLGRACRYGAHIKVGKVANGPLPISAAYVGSKRVEAASNLAYLHGQGYISFMQHPGHAGYYLGIDRMASTDDYRLLAYGRLVDKAATVAAAVYIDSLESELELNPNGNIASQEVAYLRAIVSQQIQALMGEQLSGYQVLIAEDQNIVATGKLVVQLRIQPLGYTSFIEVTVGLTATV